MNYFLYFFIFLYLHSFFYYNLILLGYDFYKTFVLTKILSILICLSSIIWSFFGLQQHCVPFRKFLFRKDLFRKFLFRNSCFENFLFRKFPFRKFLFRKFPFRKFLFRKIDLQLKEFINKYLKLK